MTYFRIFVLFFKRHTKILIPAAGIAFFLSILLIRFLPEITKPTISEGVVGTYIERDLPEVVTNLLSKSLVELDASSSAQPKLASGWRISQDATTYTFTLRDKLFWTDGSAVKASDIDIRIPDVSVKAVNDKVLEFKLGDSFSPFPGLLTKPIFKKSSKKDELQFIGVGPYRISEIQKDQIFVKKMLLSSNDKKLPNIVIRFYPSEKTAKTAFKLGEVQTLWGIGNTQDLKDDPTLVYWSRTNYNQVVAVFYNIKDPTLSDINLRLALSYGAPVIGGEARAKTPLPPLSWAFDPDVKEFLGDEAQARIFLDKASKGKDEVVTLTTTPYLKDVGEKVINEWKKAGIRAILRVESGIPQNFQALLITQNIPSDPDQYSLWHSTQEKTNISKISSPRIDKDLEDARKTTNVDERTKKYHDFQKVLLDQAPATFLYFPRYNVVLRDKVTPYIEELIRLQVPHI